MGIKDTLGSLVLAGTDLANQLAQKVVELNSEYKAKHNGTVRCFFLDQPDLVNFPIERNL